MSDTIKQFYATGRFSQKDAEELGPEIERLARLKGSQLDAMDLLNEARKDPSSPVAARLTENPNEAAEQWWLAQCRGILNHVHYRIVEVKTNRVVEEGPILICSPKDGREVISPRTGVTHNLRPYVLTQVIRSQPDRQQEVLEEVRRQIAGFRHRLQMLETLFGRQTPALTLLQQSLEQLEQEIEDEAELKIAA